MTAATLTEARAVTWASAVLHRALGITWPEPARPAIRDAWAALQDAIEIHSSLLNDDLHWEAYDAGIAEYTEAARYDVALGRSAQDAEELAWVLVEAIGKLAGEDAAAYVSGGEGGEQ
jgi:hypothetical protein